MSRLLRGLTGSRYPLTSALHGAEASGAKHVIQDVKHISFRFPTKQILVVSMENLINSGENDLRPTGADPRGRLVKVCQLDVKFADIDSVVIGHHFFQAVEYVLLNFEMRPLAFREKPDLETITPLRISRPKVQLFAWPSVERGTIIFKRFFPGSLLLKNTRPSASVDEEENPKICWTFYRMTESRFPRTEVRYPARLAVSEIDDQKIYFRSRPEVAGEVRLIHARNFVSACVDRDVISVELPDPIETESDDACAKDMFRESRRRTDGTRNACMQSQFSRKMCQTVVSPKTRTSLLSYACGEANDQAIIGQCVSPFVL